MPTLTEIVTDLEPALLESLADIRVELDAVVPTAMTATLSFSLFRQPPTERVIGPEPLPDGVGLMPIERWPAMVKPLALEPDVMTQIRDLDASGLVGHLDAAQYVTIPGDPAAIASGHPPVSYLIKTHAGSAAERQEWAATHNRKPGRPRLHHEPRQDVRVSLPVELIARLDAASDNRTAWIEAAIRQRLERDAR